MPEGYREAWAALPGDRARVTKLSRLLGDVLKVIKVVPLCHKSGSIFVIRVTPLIS